MKKKLVLIVSMLVIVCLGLMVGCKAEKTDLDIVKENISFCQETLYSGTSEKFDVALTSGKNSEMFIADGIADTVMDYCKLKVSPTSQETVEEITFTINGEKGKIVGTLKKEVIGKQYSTNIENIDSIGAVSNVELKSNNATETISLENKINGEVSSDKALEIAFNHKKEMLKDDFANKEFKREVYIKYIEDTASENTYYWYVSFIKDVENNIVVLIEPTSGKVIN